MLVALDRQHRGRKSKPADNGAVSGSLIEADLTERYIAVADAELRRLGHQTLLLTTGEYHERQQKAVAAASDYSGVAVYLACHINAGGGKYALVEYDARSTRGRAFASLLSTQFATGLAEASLGKFVGLDSTIRGFTCISGIYAGPAELCGVIVEPGFIDSPSHASLWTPEGLTRIGKIIATTCDVWAHD